MLKRGNFLVPNPQKVKKQVPPYLKEPVFCIIRLKVNVRACFLFYSETYPDLPQCASYPENF